MIDEKRKRFAAESRGESGAVVVMCRVSSVEVST